MSNDSEAEEADDDETQHEETEAAEEEVEEEEAEEEVEGLQDGDFIKLAYTARTVEDGDLVDTTDEEVAEEADIDTEGQEFAPRTIVLGQGHIFESVEEDVIGKDVGDSGSVVVSAEEAFGEYDDEQVRTVSKDKIPEDDRYPGAQVQIDQQQGFVETIIGGRARVDFNHPLAGEDIEYEYEIVGEVTDRQDKAEGLIDMMLDLDLDVFFQTDTVEEEQMVESEDDEDEDEESEPEFETVEVEKETLYIEATPQLSMNQQWMMGKQQIAQQLTQLLDIDRIIVQEELGGGGMGMPGMMGGMGGGAGGADLEAALEDADIDADELAEDLPDDLEE